MTDSPVHFADTGDRLEVRTKDDVSKRADVATACEDVKGCLN